MEVEISQRDGSRLSKADFEVVRKEVLELAKRPEGLRPEDLLERARNPSSPLHKFFEWDNATAAEKYRLEQARKLIYTVQIRVIEDGAEPLRGSFAIRVVDPEDGRSTYRPISDVMNDEQLRAQVVQRALDEHRAWEARYQHLHELAEIFKTTDALRRKIAKLLAKTPVAPSKRRKRAG